MSLASAISIDVENKSLSTSSQSFPLKIALFGQPTSSASGITFNKPVLLNGAKDAGAKFGYGSPLHLMATVLYNPERSIDAIPCYAFPIDTLSGATVATGDLSFSGTQTSTQDYVLHIASSIYYFTIAKGSTASEVSILVKSKIDSDANCPVTTGTISSGAIPLTSKWKGITANDIKIEFLGPIDGIVVSTTSFSGGTGGVDITSALLELNNVWYPYVVTQFTDSTTLHAFVTKYIELSTPLNHRPFITFLGDIEEDSTALLTASAVYKNSKALTMASIPGLQSLPFEGASSYANLVTTTATFDSAIAYNKQPLYGLIPGGGYKTFDFITANNLELGGISPTYLDHDVLYLLDGITTNVVPDGEPTGYRYVVSVTKLFQIVYDLNHEFTGENWKSKILVGDRDRVTNPNARTPSYAQSTILGLLQIWESNGLIRDISYSTKHLSVKIDPNNPNNLIIILPVILSGNLRQINLTLNFDTNFIEN